MTNKQLQSSIIPWRSSSSFHAIASFYMKTKCSSRNFSRGKIWRRFDANTRMSFTSCLYFEWRLIDSRIEVCYSNKDKSVLLTVEYPFLISIWSALTRLYHIKMLWSDSGYFRHILSPLSAGHIPSDHEPGVLGGPRRQIIGFVWSEKSRAAARSSLRGQRVGTKESCRGHSMKTNNEINFTRLLFN